MTESIIGSKIGHFRFVEKIATGGMGEVYEGYDETLQRKVALKGIRPEYHLDGEAKGRFLREARVLSQLGHPNICQIYDYLESDKSDYIVMELVEGTNLSHAMRKGLDGRTKMRIAEEVAGVLVAAHEKGVVHRDLKPDNVMLTDGDEVKVLDFGLSRQLGEEPPAAPEEWIRPEAPARVTALSEDEATHVLGRTADSSQASGSSSSLTTVGAIMGTIGYMSPEQARGEVATAASDMYSFGLLLQELFTGEPPYEPGLKATERLEKAKRGETRPVAGLDADLEALIDRLKALEPAARPSAVDVAEKLERIRRKPQRRRRRRLIYAAMALLAVFGATMTVQTIRATRAEKRAREEAETAKQVSKFLVDLFKVSDPSESRGRTITAREILDKGARNIQEELKGQPSVQARLLATIGTVYAGLGLYKDAEPLLSSALALREKALGPQSPEVAESLNDLAGLYGEEGRYSEAERLYVRELAILEKLLGPDDPDVAICVNNLAVLYWSQGRYDMAEPLYKRALTIRESALGPYHPDVAESLNNLAVLYRNEGRYAEAEPLYKQALANREENLGPDHPEVAKSLSNLAVLYGTQGRYAEAEPLLVRSLAIREKAFGPDHPDVAQALNNLALLYLTQGNYAKAEPLLARSLAIREKALGPDHPIVANSLCNLSALYCDEGKYAEAEPLSRRALAIREKTLGPGSRETAEALRNLAVCEFKQKKYPEALADVAAALGIGQQLAAKTPNDKRVRFLSGAVLLLKGRIESAMGEDPEAQASWKEGLTVMGPVVKDAKGSEDLDAYAQLLLCLGRAEEARPVVKKLLDSGYKSPDLLPLCREKGLAPAEPATK